MAIAVDSTSTGAAAAGTTITVSHTCTGSNLVLVSVVAASDGVSTPSVTYDGVSMSLVKSINDTGKMSSFMFVLVGPNTGTHDIVVTKDSGSDFGVASVSFSGAGGYSATGSANSSSSGTASVTTTTATSGNGYVVGGGGKNVVNTVTYTGSGTEYANFNSASVNQVYMAAYTAFAGGADVTESWTFTAAKWALTSVEIYEFTSSANSGFMSFM